jgi:hypothetical protein
MKLQSIYLCLLLPVTALAQNYPAMNEADMQKMMQQMEKMQSCMEKIDQGKLEALGVRSEQMEAEINALCARGKRDEAQQKAMAYGKEITNDAVMKAMMKCTEGMQAMMPELSFTGVDEDSTGLHVCD